MAQAQSIPPQDLSIIQRQQDEIQRRNETQRLLDETKSRAKTLRGQQTPSEPPASPPLSGDLECFWVDTINLNGATLLNDKEKEKLTEPYVGRCISLGDVNGLLRAITNLYSRKGYITARGYVSAQETNDGVFDIQVVEGFIEGFELQDKEKKERWRLGTAFPFTRDKPLNMRDIEQGLDQINRLKSNNAKVSLKPGTKQGATIVRIDNDSTKPWHLDIGTDNSGKKGTGVGRWNGKAGMDDLLGLNDYLSVSWSRNLDESKFAKSQSVAGFFSVPLGYLTLSASSSYFNHASEVKATTAAYKSTGYSRTHKLEVDTVVHRDQKSKSNISAFLRQHTSASFVNQLKLETSSYRLTVLGLNIGHRRRAAGGILYGGIKLEQGIRALGARKDRNAADSSVPRAQFHKAEIDLSFFKPFEFKGQKFSYVGGAHGQWSPMTLYPASQISIGGKESVRGFHEETLGGTSGAYVQNTINWELPQTGNPLVDKTFGSFSPFIGFDIGALKKNLKSSSRKGVLSGYAIGFKTSGGFLSLSATYGRALRSPASLNPRDHEIYLSATLGI